MDNYRGQCPFCGCTNTSKYDAWWELEGREYRIDRYCEECGKNWIEVLTVTEVLDSLDNPIGL